MTRGVDPTRVGLAAATFLALEIGFYGVWQPLGRPVSIPAVAGAVIGLGSVISLHLVARRQPRALGNVLGAWLALATVLVFLGAFGTRSLHPAWDLLLSALLLVPVQIHNLVRMVEWNGLDLLPFLPLYFWDSPTTLIASVGPALATGFLRGRWGARGSEVVLAVGGVQALALLAAAVPPIRTPYTSSLALPPLAAAVAAAALGHGALAWLGATIARPVESLPENGSDPGY